ncbi:CaMKI [Symbiodinium pilosum]|uniref:CaMKI protein n=1 Tax=Symbiodinium pilosum TaxID=2952 RepID=A0A812THJ5_SYMPI|nr:CaMKI [Symbiodinium pilosum]
MRMYMEGKDGSMFPSSSSSAPGPTFWFHSCHGQDARQLAPVIVNRSGSATVAEAFAAEAEAPDALGLRCNVEGLALVAEDAGEESATVVPSLLMVEVSWCSFRTASDPDMALIALVPPTPGCGIRGTSIAGLAQATAGWFIIVQGCAAHDFVDMLSVRGCLRTDFDKSFSMAHDGDCVIGEGAYATVYHMKAPSGREVAVKQMNHTSDLESIEREVAALVQLQGDNIIGFRGVFWKTETEQIRFYNIFDLAPGGDLLYKVLKSGGMTEAAARPLFIGILRGLKHIHDHDIVHRDVKTENILLQSGGVPMLADFGLACKITDEQQMSRRCGSAGFVAPEVCLGTPYDCKVDNFGAGVILYFMLSREMPFSSPDRDSAATMRKTVKCSLHLQRPPFDSMTSRLRNILRQLICKSQEDRLTAASALEHSWIAGKSDKSGSSSSSKKKEKVMGEVPVPLDPSPEEPTLADASEAQQGHPAAPGGPQNDVL